MVTQDRLKQAVEYNPYTGEFFRKTSAGGFKVGSLAGSINTKTGYRYISVDSRYYLAHRLAWLYYYGVWPSGSIDHINHIRDDNRIENLRDVSAAANNLNLGLANNNTSGHSGVVWDKNRSLWVATLKLGGKNIHLGRFPSMEEAAAARKGALAVARRELLVKTY